MQAYRYIWTTVEKFDENTNTFKKDKEYHRASLSKELLDVLDANPGKPVMLKCYTDYDWKKKFDPNKKLLYFPKD